MENKKIGSKEVFIKRISLYIFNMLKMEGISNKPIVKFFLKKLAMAYKTFVDVFVHLVDNQLQMIEWDTCAMYLIYFYLNFFNPLESGDIFSEKTLNKRIIEKLLNEILSADRQENENRIEQFAKEQDKQ